MLQTNTHQVKVKVKPTQNVVELQVGRENIVVSIVRHCTEIFVLVVVRHSDAQWQRLLLLRVVHLEAFQIARGGCACC